MMSSRLQLLALKPGPELDEAVCYLLGGERKVRFPALPSLAPDESADSRALIAAGCDIGYALPRASVVRIVHAVRPIERADAGERLFMPSRRDDHALELMGLLAAAGLNVTIGRAVVSVGDEGLPPGRYPLPHALALLAVLVLARRNRFVVRPNLSVRFTPDHETAWTRALEEAGPVGDWVRLAEAGETRPAVTIDGFGVTASRTEDGDDLPNRLRVTVRAPDRYNNSPAMWSALGRATAKAFAGHSMLAGCSDIDALDMIFDIPVRTTSPVRPVLKAA